MRAYTHYRNQRALPSSASAQHPQTKCRTQRAHALYDSLGYLERKAG